MTAPRGECMHLFCVNAAQSSVHNVHKTLHGTSRYITGELYRLLILHPVCVTWYHSKSWLFHSAIFMFIHLCCATLALRGSVLGLRPPGLESCVWRTVSSQSSHHPQEVLLAQFILSAQRWPKARFISFLVDHDFITLLFLCSYTCVVPLWHWGRGP